MKFRTLCLDGLKSMDFVAVTPQTWCPRGCRPVTPVRPVQVAGGKPKEFLQLRQPMKRLLQGGSPKPKAALTEEQQIQLATELSLEDATEAAVKMSLNDHHTAAQAEPHSATEAVTMESEGKGSDDPSPNPLAHLPKPEGSVYLHASFLFLKLFFTT